MQSDKGLLKKQLYQDQANLMDAIAKESDSLTKKLLQEALNIVNKYILICVKRNKFQKRMVKVNGTKE